MRRICNMLQRVSSSKGERTLEIADENNARFREFLSKKLATFNRENLTR